LSFGTSKVLVTSTTSDETPGYKNAKFDIRRLSFGIDAEKSIEKAKHTLSSVSESLALFETAQR